MDREKIRGIINPKMSTELALNLQILDNNPSDEEIYKKPRKIITNGRKVPVIESYIAPLTLRACGNAGSFYYASQ